MYAVFYKELADHFNSKRFTILFALASLAAILAIYVATQSIRGEVSASTEFIFLKIFTISGEALPSFLFFMSLFIPIISISLGFDSISSEYSSGNLSRLLSQPIHRDAVINGKFLSGLTILSIIIVSVVAIVVGLGLRTIGVPPTSEEVLRLIVFVLISIIYGAFWMALAVLFSILFKKASTSMLSTIGLWIFFFFFMSMIASAIADAQIPLDSNSTLAMITQNAEISGTIGRISPCNLYGEAITALLVPQTASLNSAIMLISTLIEGRMLTPLPFSQSLLLVWPQLTSIIALAAICFAISYIKFMKQEIRSI